MRTDFSSLNTRSLLLLIALALVFSCRAYEQLHRQTPTFANLQHIVEQVEVVVSERGYVTEAEMARILTQYNKGRDEWGTPYVFRSRNHPEFSYILVSLGSDKALDVESIDAYFELAETDIVGQFDRDIVFRDGKHVTIASAK